MNPNNFVLRNRRIKITKFRDEKIHMFVWSNKFLRVFRFFRFVKKKKKEKYEAAGKSTVLTTRRRLSNYLLSLNPFDN